MSHPKVAYELCNMGAKDFPLFSFGTGQHDRRHDAFSTERKFCTTPAVTWPDFGFLLTH
jgi:hypothetical protein